MLTAALRVYHWDRSASSISSDRLDAAALPPLRRAIRVYRARIGQRRGQVRNAARIALEGVRPDRVAPLIKLLDDVASYEWPTGARQAERRLAVFAAGAVAHPLVDPAEVSRLLATVLAPSQPLPHRVPDDREPSSSPSRAAVAGSHEEAVARLYADYPEFHRLREFPVDYSAEALRSDYDLAQAQALLFSATQVTVEAQRDFKHVLRYARLARLLHVLERTPHGYRFVFDGPNSVLRRTHAYGVDFARFLAGLVRARDWALRAEIELRRGWRPFTFTLSAGEGLGAGRRPPLDFDSSLEETFARRFGEERDGWRLSREAVVLEAGGSLMVPDFVFTHSDGTEIILEIVGYWTPEYVDQKLRKLKQVRGSLMIVAVPKRLALRAASELPAAVVPFSKRLPPHDVVARLETLRTGAPP